jgi:SAM-dependent methyltransferase
MDSTTEYFEQNTPVYSQGRYTNVVAFLRAQDGEGASLLDIGCGSGNILRLIADNTRIAELGGLDVSPNYLEQCARAVPCETHLGSILDDSLRAGVGRSYRYVLVGAVLHHLVGSTRRASLEMARRGMVNAWQLVEEGGCLIVMEPTFRPRLVCTGLFHVKRFVSRFTRRRVPVLGRWNNLGEPIVSYFSHDELLLELAHLPGATIALDIRKRKARPLLWRLAGVTERSDSILILRRTE